MAKGGGQKKSEAPAKWILMPAEEKMVRELIETSSRKVDGVDVRWFPHLDEATFVVVGRPKASSKGGNTKIASVRKAKPIERLFRELDGGEQITHILEVGLDVWNAATEKDKEIYLFHELMIPQGKDESGRWGGMNSPEVQEFVAVVQQYGAYTPRLTKLVEAGAQMALPMDSNVRAIGAGKKK